MKYTEIDYIVDNKILDDKRIYDAFEPLIISNIKNYYDKADIFRQLVDEGKTEIMYAILDYDKSKKVPFNSYLKTRLKYFYLNKNRFKKDYSLNAQMEDGEEFIETLSSNEDIAGEFEEKLEIKKLYQNVKKLPEKQRQIIYENFLREKSAKQICSEYNIKQSTFYNTRRKALENLRNMY